MDAKLKNLRLILQRMNVLYERLLALLARERDCLIHMDFDALMIEMREKDEILAALRGLDRDRLRIQDQFAIVMGAELSLRDLAEKLIEQGGSAREDGMALMDLRGRMQGTLEALRARIATNTDFIERSVHNLQGVAASLSSAVTGKANAPRAMNVYNGKAKYQSGSAPTTGAIMEKRL